MNKDGIIIVANSSEVVLTKEVVKATLMSGKSFNYYINEQGVLRIVLGLDDRYDQPVNMIAIDYGVPENIGTPEIDIYWHFTGEYFPVDQIDKAIDVYIDRANSEYPMRNSGKGYKHSDISVYNVGIVFYKNHYDYLDKMLEPFWVEVFGKTPSEMWCGGIVGAHADKCYGYRREWEEHGINYNRGSLLFLLTYTKEFGDNEKYLSNEWVIQNYAKYLPAILKAETYVLEHIFDKDKNESHSD